MSGANLSGPEVIRDFRPRLAAFLHTCRSTLGDRSGALARMKDWLRCEQGPYWKSQIRRREEDYEAARRRWLEAEGDVQAAEHGRGSGKQSSVDERIAMDRARRRKEEAEQKLEAVRRWLLRLEKDGEPLAHACQVQDFALRELGEKALARLDRLAGDVEAYLERGPGPRPAGGGTGGPSCPA